MELKRKSKKIKKRFGELVSIPFRGGDYGKESITVSSFQGRDGDGPLKPYVEIDGISFDWLTESEARRLAKCILSHADRIKRYKENERARCKS